MVDPPPAPKNKTLEYYALAAPWGAVTREKPLPPNNDFRGVFSTAILEGLGGLAADKNGNVTDKSLSSYVYQAMEQMLKEEYTDPRLRPDARADIVFASGVKPKERKTRLSVTFSNPGGNPVSIKDGTLAVIATHSPADGPWTLELDRGLYLLDNGAGQLKHVVVQGADVDEQL
jgi:hypothetical protein